MARKFSELRARMSPKARTRSEAMTKKLLEQVPRKHRDKRLSLRNGKLLKRS